MKEFVEILKFYQFQSYDIEIVNIFTISHIKKAFKTKKFKSFNFSFCGIVTAFVSISFLINEMEFYIFLLVYDVFKAFTI